jgi:hypothetical protein
LSKVDLVDAERLLEITQGFEARGLRTLSASSVTGQGLDPLVHAVVSVMDATAEAPA